MNNQLNAVNVKVERAEVYKTFVACCDTIAAQEQPSTETRHEFQARISAWKEMLRQFVMAGDKVDVIAVLLSPNWDAIREAARKAPKDGPDGLNWLLSK